MPLPNTIPLSWGTAGMHSLDNVPATVWPKRNPAYAPDEWIARFGALVPDIPANIRNPYRLVVLERIRNGHIG